MGEDELGQAERIAVAASVRFLVAAELLLPEVVKMVMPLTRVLPHGSFDSRGVLGRDAAVDLDDVGLPPVLVRDVVAQPDGRPVVESVFEVELWKRVPLGQTHVEVIADTWRLAPPGREKAAHEVGQRSLRLDMRLGVEPASLDLGEHLRLVVATLGDISLELPPEIGRA